MPSHCPSKIPNLEQIKGLPSPPACPTASKPTRIFHSAAFPPLAVKINNFYHRSTCRQVPPSHGRGWAGPPQAPSPRGAGKSRDEADGLRGDK